MVGNPGEFIYSQQVGPHLSFGSSHHSGRIPGIGPTLQPSWHASPFRKVLEAAMSGYLGYSELSCIINELFLHCSRRLGKALYSNLDVPSLSAFQVPKWGAWAGWLALRTAHMYLKTVKDKNSAPNPLSAALRYPALVLKV